MAADYPEENLWPLDFLSLLQEDMKHPEEYFTRLSAFRDLRNNSKAPKNLLLEELTTVVLAGSKYFAPIESKQTYFYHADRGIWLPRAEHMIETLCRHLWPGLSRWGINEIIGKIRNYRLGSLTTFNRKLLVAFKNGTFNLETWRIEAHKPEHYLTKAIPVDYNPKKDCPKIREFLSQITSEENVRILEEAIGYCLFPRHPYQRAFLLFGPTQTGKSTFLKILKTFLGPENVINLTLQQIASRKYGLDKIKNKFANISPDMPNKMIYDTGLFKALLAEDGINTDVKYGDDVDFVNTAKLFFSANVIPPTKYDDSKAYTGKWIICDFPNQFLDTADEDLVEKLTTPGELSGLLNLAITGLRRLRIRGRFEETIDLEAKETAYFIGSDTVKGFLHLKCEVDESYSVIKIKSYEAYKDFCREYKRTSTPYNTFTQALKKWVPNLKPTKYTIQGKRVPVYEGFQLKQSKLVRGTL